MLFLPFSDGFLTLTLVVFTRGNEGLRAPSDSNFERKEKRQTLAAFLKMSM